MMESLTLKDILWAGGTVVGAVIAWLLSRRKYLGDAKAVEFKTFDLEMSKFLELLERIEKAHEQSMADDEIIAQLRRDVAACADGHKDWVDCRDEAVEFLNAAETELTALDGMTDLVKQIAMVKGRLAVLTFGSKDK